MMKKETKGHAGRGEGQADRMGRLRSKEFVYSSPNKENDLGSANLLSPSSPLAPLSPLAPTSPPAPSSLAFLSPQRTTPLENLECLRSNKSKESLQEGGHSDILFSGISRDGRFRVESRSLQGEELSKAVEYEKKTALSTTIAAGREREREKAKLPEIEASRVSSKENGVVRAYAINTHAGTTRSYNEDRVSVTLNIKKNGTRSQFFAVYDGHGGSGCCDYLKDRLHEQLIAHKDFPSDPKRALHDALSACERGFCEAALQAGKEGKEGKEGVDRSGSCALVALLVEDYCYVANVGDSRAVLSAEGGRLAFNLSRDHRPIDPKEQQRIFQRGGKIYRTEMTRIPKQEEQKGETIIGPLRIFPGKLSVSRTIGDVEAKEERLGGTRGVISAEPEIKKFRLTGNEDFVMLCCDGVFERMESMEVIEVAWRAMRREGSPHELAGKAVDAVIREAMRRRSADNLTAIMISLSDLRQKGQLQSP